MQSIPLKSDVTEPEVKVCASRCLMFRSWGNKALDSMRMLSKKAPLFIHGQVVGPPRDYREQDYKLACVLGAWPVMWPRLAYREKDMSLWESGGQCTSLPDLYTGVRFVLKGLLSQILWFFKGSSKRRSVWEIFQRLTCAQFCYGTSCCSKITTHL